VLEFDDAESATCTVNADDIACDGVPSIAPDVAATVRPGGSCPEEMDQVYGGVPPVAVRVVEYAVPICPSGSELVEIDKGGGPDELDDFTTPQET